ncbi:MAG: serine protease [Verrucomicrobiales bacterium]
MTSLTFSDSLQANTKAPACLALHPFLKAILNMLMLNASARVAIVLGLLLQLWTATPGWSQDSGLPQMISETEKGVFFIRVLDTDGKLISSGTAFLVDEEGTLATALHVIRPGIVEVGSLEVLDKNGKTWIVSGLTAHDAAVDLALLRLAKMPKGARPVALAEDTLPVRGAKVFVLGHPQGFQFVATDGIVSATHKTDKLPPQIRARGLVRSLPDVVWIQTTAAISGGNSGGPMLDASGKVIGVIQWISNGQAMNFGVHVASLRKLLAQPKSLVNLSEFTRPSAEFFTLQKEFQVQVSSQRMGTGFSSIGSNKSKSKPATHPSAQHVPKFLAFADTHRGKDIEFRALMSVMAMACQDGCPEEVKEDVKKASDRLIAQFKDDRRVHSFLRSSPKPTLVEAQKFFQRATKAGSTSRVAALLATPGRRLHSTIRHGRRGRHHWGTETTTRRRPLVLAATPRPRIAPPFSGRRFP